MNQPGRWLSRVSPREELSPAQLVKLGDLSPYGQHQALWKLFNANKSERNGRAEFLFRCDKKNSLPVFYLLSQRKPLDILGTWLIESKALDPDIRAGDRLAFKLRVNPTISKPVDAGRRGKRHDAVMDAKVRLGWKEIPLAQRPPLAQVVQDAGEKWLCSRQARLGAQIDENLRADGYRTWRRQGSKGIELATLDFEGSLRVTNADRFVQSMFDGIGPAKAFGCGLLLVKRV
jgi:CRISPR system Cascade subunit CasE